MKNLNRDLARLTRVTIDASVKISAWDVVAEESEWRIGSHVNKSVYSYVVWHIEDQLEMSVLDSVSISTMNLVQDTIKTK